MKRSAAIALVLSAFVTSCGGEEFELVEFKVRMAFGSVSESSVDSIVVLFLPRNEEQRFRSGSGTANDGRIEYETLDDGTFETRVSREYFDNNRTVDEDTGSIVLEVPFLIEMGPEGDMNLAAQILHGGGVIAEGRSGVAPFPPEVPLVFNIQISCLPAAEKECLGG